MLLASMPVILELGYVSFYQKRELVWDSKFYGGDHLPNTPSFIQAWDRQ